MAVISGSGREVWCWEAAGNPSGGDEQGARKSICLNAQQEPGQVAAKGQHQR